MIITQIIMIIIIIYAADLGVAALAHAEHHAGRGVLEADLL